MQVIKSMLHTKPQDRASAFEILNNKSLQIRGQDYQLRKQFSSEKQKFDKNSKDLTTLNEDISNAEKFVKMHKH